MSGSIWEPVQLDDGVADQLDEACGAALDALEASAGCHVTAARDRLGEWTGRLRSSFDINEGQLQQVHQDVFFELCAIRGSISTWKFEAASLRNERQHKREEWRAAQEAIAAAREQAVAARSGR